MNMSFEMLITDIFRLSNGATIFAGHISEAARIGRGTCELRSANGVRQTIHCEGEPIVKKIDPSNTLRSVATLDNVDLSIEEAQSGIWKLVGVD